MSQGIKAEPVSDEAQEEQRAALSDDDRCDVCGARAYYEMELKNGVLLFCGHHFTHHEHALEEVAIDIHDHSHELIP